jgi:hypothetical protein
MPIALGENQVCQGNALTCGAQARIAHTFVNRHFARKRQIHKPVIVFET